MAEAIRTTRSVEKLISVDEDVITLTLSVDEALTLRALLSRVSGDTICSPRHHVDRMTGALVAGAGITIGGAHEARQLVSGHIDFANYPNGGLNHG